MEGMACSWIGASYTSKAAKSHPRWLRQWHRLTAFFLPGLAKCKQELNVSVALCKRYKPTMSLSLEIRYNLYWKGAALFQRTNHKSHLFYAECQLLRALGGSIAIWGSSSFLHTLKLAMFAKNTSKISNLSVTTHKHCRCADVGKRKTNASNRLSWHYDPPNWDVPLSSFLGLSSACYSARLRVWFISA